MVNKKCHVCGAVCEETAELCHICGAELVDTAEEISDFEEEKTIKNPVLAASVEDIVTAEIFRDILSENGILFTCDTQNDGTMKVVFGGGFVAEDIYVDESDLEFAKSLYQEVLNSEPSFDFEDDAQVE